MAHEHVSLSADRPFLLRLHETEQFSVAVARPRYIRRAAIFVPAAQTAETA
jgi:hypothetical protein